MLSADQTGASTPGNGRVSMSERLPGGAMPSYDEIFQAIRDAGPSNTAKTRAVERMLRNATAGPPFRGRDHPA